MKVLHIVLTHSWELIILCLCREKMATNLRKAYDNIQDIGILVGQGMTKIVIFPLYFIGVKIHKNAYYLGQYFDWEII